MTSVGVALPEDPEVEQELVERPATLARRSDGRWVAFVICNGGLSSLPQAEFAMRHGVSRATDAKRGAELFDAQHPTSC